MLDPEDEEWRKMLPSPGNFQSSFEPSLFEPGNFSLTLSELGYLSKMTWSGNEGHANGTELKKRVSVLCLAREEPMYRDLGNL